VLDGDLDGLRRAWLVERRKNQVVVNG
jgi:hypothetical protein